MSIALVGPLNRIAGVMERGMLESYSLVTARDRVRNFVLSLQGPGDAPILEDYLQDSTNRAGWNAVLGEAGDINAIAELALPFSAVINSQTAMNILTNSKTAMNVVAANQQAMDMIIANQTALNMLISTSIAMNAVAANQVTMDKIAANQAVLVEIFGSAVAKRAIFDSQIAEVSIRSSVVAMNYADSIAVDRSVNILHQNYDSPSPLNTLGKWFVVRCLNLYSTSTYQRGIRYYRHGNDSYEGFWEDYSFVSTGMEAPFNVNPNINTNLSPLYESLHGRFFTQLEVMQRFNSTSTGSQRYRYINMDAEGSA